MPTAVVVPTVISLPPYVRASEVYLVTFNLAFEVRRNMFRLHRIHQLFSSFSPWFHTILTMRNS